MRFIKVFKTEKDARIFSLKVKAKITVQYAWDDDLMMIVKEYVVKY